MQKARKFPFIFVNPVAMNLPNGWDSAQDAENGIHLWRSWWKRNQQEKSKVLQEEIQS